MNSARIIRQPVVAGMFYPSNPVQLREQVEQMLQQAVVEKAEGRITGIIAPHAGYMYSGSTAAHAYALLKGEKYETVVVISPRHREFFRTVSAYSGDAYETPLGSIPINVKLRSALTAQYDFVRASEQGHNAEHAVEVQLPFLQTVIPSFTLLPLVIGDQEPDVCFGLGEALGNVLKEENVLIVASTDLSHFYSSEAAAALDGVMIQDVNAFDYEGLMSDLETQRTEACGGGPAVAAMSALKHLGTQRMKVVHHSTSGDTTGDYNSVVGYFSAVAY
jgi:AmmeMemoRadiSam system protein B